MSLFNMIAVAQAAAGDDGLTFAELISNLPHDAAAIVVYVLVGGSVGLVIWSGRKTGSRDSSVQGS